MNVNDPQQYRNYVKENLEKMTKAFAGISSGDFADRVDLDKIDHGDEFYNALYGLEMMTAEIIKARSELKKTAQLLEKQVLERTKELSYANERLVRDIDERKRSEEMFAEREHFYMDVFNSIQDPISILDTSLSIIGTNQAMEQWYKEKLPIAGKKCYWVYHHKDSPCLQCPSLQTIKTGKAAFEVVPKRDALGQQIGWSALYSYPWKDVNSGEIKGVIEYIKDISELRNAQDALAAEKEMLSVTMASIGDGVVSTDTAGKILSINPIALSFTKYKLEEAVGKHIDDVLEFSREAREKGADTKQGIVRSMIEKYGIKHMAIQCRLAVPSGQNRVVDLLSVAPINQANGEVIGMVLVFRDMTERQKLELELYKGKKLESLGVLAGGIAHDFNNILTGIITNLFMAKLRTKNDQETFQLLSEAEKAAFRASKLVKQLLTFSKGGAPVKEVLAIRHIIEDSVGFCLSGSNVNYKLDIAENLETVEADRGQIDQVINNLIINSDQAMPQGGTIFVTAKNVAVNVSGDPSSETNAMLKPGPYVRIDIKDEGVGIPKENIEKIFDPYYTTKPHGNGSGLTIAYSILKAHNGGISVDSEVGKGTTVSLYIPISSKKETNGESKKADTRPSGTGEKILIMDDDVAIRSVLKQLLKSSGYDVYCTASGKDTIDAYAQAKENGDCFKVVVMDLTIPGGMGGKEAVAKILEIDKNAKVVVASGYSNDPIMANYSEYGFCGVIAKPFNIDEFLAVIKKAASTKTE